MSKEDIVSTVSISITVGVKIVIVFMNSLVNLVKCYLYFFMEYMWILYCNQLVESM